MRRAAAIAVAVAAIASHAAAQDTRSGLLERERTEKAAALHPNQASRVERVRYEMEHRDLILRLGRPDDAFRAARIVSRFSDEAIRAVVAKARYRDARAAEYIASTIVKRRDKVVRHWSTGINPIVDPVLGPDGMLTFRNAAVDAGLTSATPVEYTLRWSRFDNAADALVGRAEESRTAGTTSAAPPGVLEGAPFVAVAIETIHPDYPQWREPVRVYFRRTVSGWLTVGLDRLP